MSSSAKKKAASCEKVVTPILDGEPGGLRGYRLAPVVACFFIVVG